MDSKEFRELINKERPRYSNIHRSLIDKMSVKGNRNTEFISFGPYYQTFMYAFFIGYHVGNRTELPSKGSTSDFYEIGKWKPDSIVNYILAIIYTNLNKNGFNWVELEQYDKKQLSEHVGEIVTIMEEYANTGFIYLENKYDNEPEYFADIYSFVNLLNNLTIDKQTIQEVVNPVGIDEEPTIKNSEDY